MDRLDLGGRGYRSEISLHAGSALQIVFQGLIRGTAPRFPVVVALPRRVCTKPGPNFRTLEEAYRARGKVLPGGNAAFA